MFRNLFYILRRFKVTSLLNVLGLSVAFASFIIILMQVTYETSFNANHRDASRIYRLESCLGDANPFYAVSARPMEEVLRHAPTVQNVAVMLPNEYSGMVIYKDEVKGERKFKENMVFVNKDFPAIFSFHMLEGVVESLSDPEKGFICESLARKLFPDESAMGKVVETDLGATFTVGGVYRDFPANSTTKNNVYLHLPEELGATDWNNKGYYIYVLLDEGAPADSTIYNSVADLIDLDGMSVAHRSLTNYFRFNNIRDTYWSKDVMYDYGETGSRQTNWLLICIAIVILIIATINYANFSISLAPLRIKSINTEKVLGASIGKLRFSLIGESVVISVFSFFLSLLWVNLCRGTFIEQLLSPALVLSAHIGIVTIGALLSILLGLVAGTYPAIYLTSFPPALVLKGSFGLSPRGRRFRTILLGFQYVASLVLLIIAAFMYLQNHHMVRSDFGYDKDQILTAEVPGSFLPSAPPLFNELKSAGVIEEGAFAAMPLSSYDSYPRWRTYWGANNDIIIFDVMMVSADFLKVMGLKVYEGRDFRESDNQLKQSLYIFNKTAADRYALEVDKPIARGFIVGFVPDFQYATFRRPIGPFTFSLIGEGLSTSTMYLYFRIPAGAPYRSTVEKITASMKAFDSSYPYEVTNLNLSIQKAYMNERHVSSLISLASVLSILISIIGILSLVTFETLYRRKEIGLRKIMGSTTLEVMKMFSMKYITISVTCSIISIPIGYLIVTKWLSSFTSRTPIYWWVFFLAFLIIAAVSILTISRQNYKAATGNPIDSIKNE